MSKFFRAQESSSEEESSSGSDSEQEQVAAQAKGAAAGGATKTSAFAAGGDSSSDEDEGPRVVKSARDKRWDELVTAVGVLNGNIKSGDWAAVLDGFEKLLKLTTKMAPIIAKEGIPGVYVKAIADMDDKMTEVVANKEETRKMKPAQAKALNALKQRLRKYTKEEAIDKAISEYRANPTAFADAAPASAAKAASSSSESEDDDDESEDDKKGKGPAKAVPSKFAKNSAPAPAPAPAAAKPKPAPAATSSVPSKFAKKGSSSEDDDDDDGSGDDWSDSDSDAGEVTTKASGASKWLKKEPKKLVATKTTKPADKPKPTAKKDESSSDEESTKPAVTREQSSSQKVELTEEGADAKLKEIISMRGKKGTDRKEQIAQLQLVLEFTKSPLKQAQILVHLTSAQFDINPSLNSHMSVDMWRRCFQNIEKLLSIVKSNADIVLNEEGVGGQEAEDDADEEQPLVMGNLLAFLERLDDELYKSLQMMESHSSDYSRRLQDTTALIKLADGIHDYYVGIGNYRAAARASMRRLEHLYYKPDDLLAVATREERAANVHSEQYKLIQALCTEIYKHGDDRTKTRAVLCHIYYHALHDRYAAGRDLMLMSHLQETVQQTDVSTMILYNRATAQLGLCAFRTGLIAEAHSCLGEVCGLGRTKELLAQGIAQSRFDRNAEQERIEKRRMVPYHLHINLDLLECCHLVSAMLIEIPFMAANAYDVKRKAMSKPLRRLFEHYERQVLAGPPESMREFVMAGARALKDGDWKRCANLILSLDVWNHMRDKAVVKEMLRRKIQEEALRTYLFTFSQHYDAMSVDQLCQIFDLPHQLVHSIVSRMMISQELHASWDQVTNSIVLHHVEPTRLQFFALQFAEKVQIFVENNERAAETRFGIVSNLGNNSGNNNSGGGNNNNREGRQYERRNYYDGNQQQDKQQGGSYSYGNNNRYNNNNNNNNNNNRGGQGNRQQQQQGGGGGGGSYASRVANNNNNNNNNNRGGYSR